MVLYIFEKAINKNTWFTTVLQQDLWGRNGTI